jgi:hypothetical protein
VAKDQRDRGGKRKYPEVYERMIPIALGIILVAIVVVLIIAAAIALRLVPGVSY